MQPKRPQQNWMIRVNNAKMMVNPCSEDIQKIYSFCQMFNNFVRDFAYISMSIQKVVKFDEPFVVIDTEDNLAMVIEVLKEQKFIFIDTVNETKTSYKGYISLIILATFNQLYLIDSGCLHDKCYELKEVLMRNNLIKFMHDCEEVLYSLKRDFEIFIPNVFDLEIIQRYLHKKGRTSFQPKIAFKEFISSCPSIMLTARPINQSLLSAIQQFYENEMTMLTYLNRFFATQDPEFQCYAYFNHYEFLLKSYYHHVPSVREIDELYKIKQGITENNMFRQYNQHQEVNLLKQQQWKHKNQFWVKDNESECIAGMLCQWREHVAKMRDINVEEVLPYEKLSTLAKTKINSILQISQICSTLLSQNGIYSLSLDEYEQIFELFQFYKNEKQQKTHELVIPRRIPYYKANQQKPIKQLFQELKFTDINNDWLNKKNDESVRLYKQIVSINEFDSSIVQEYLKEMTHKKHTSSQLNIQDINRYIKYAEYLRNGNHKRLQELYQRTKKDKNNKNKKCTNDEQQQQFEENFIQGDKEQYKNWDEVQHELNLPIINLKGCSMESLNNIGSADDHSFGNLRNLKSPRALKEKKFNSLAQLESPCYWNKIEPLPENIQAIYLEAAKAKKNYVSKGQKKNGKPNKKQAKANLDKNPKKEEDFIPKKEEIFNLIYY